MYFHFIVICFKPCIPIVLGFFISKKFKRIQVSNDLVVICVFSRNFCSSGYLHYIKDCKAKRAGKPLFGHEGHMRANFELGNVSDGGKLCE